MAIDTMRSEPALGFIMEGFLEGSFRLRMNMTGIAELICGGGFYRFAASPHQDDAYYEAGKKK